MAKANPTTRLLKVARWDETFENASSRKLRYLDRIQVPIDFGSTGYAEIMALPDGASIYGVWIVITAIAAGCSPRGTLRRSDGRAHDARSIASIARIGVQVVERAMDVLASDAIGWLVSDSKRVTKSATIRQSSPNISQHVGGNGMEVGGNGGKVGPRARAEYGTGRDGNITPPLPPKGDEPGEAPTEDQEPQLPDALRTPEFVSAWADWEADRRAKRIKPYTDRGKAAQWKRLAGWGVARAIAAIESSIAQQSQGIYEGKGDHRAARGSPAAIPNPSHERERAETRARLDELHRRKAEAKAERDKKAAENLQ